jgi:hypothetical protein
MCAETIALRFCSSMYRFEDTSLNATHTCSTRAIGQEGEIYIIRHPLDLVTNMNTNCLCLLFALLYIEVMGVQYKISGASTTGAHDTGQVPRGMGV